MHASNEPVANQLLFIGVLSFNASGRLGLRNALRRLVVVGSHATLRFCLPADEPDSDADSNDVLHLHIPAFRRSTHGKLFLQNAMLRFGFARGYAFVGRADDDALFSPSTAAGHLQELQAVQLNATHVVYGMHKLWYRWHERSMQAACWDQSWVRWTRAVAANSTTDMCVQEGLVGPYPFAAGPFMAYSRAVLARLLPLVLDGEQRVLGERWRVPLVNAVTGRVVRPEQRSHPANRLFMEEVWLGALVYGLFREEALTLVDVPMAEFSGRRPPTASAHVYHRVKHPGRFEALAAASRYGKPWQRETKLRCAPLRDTDGSGARRGCAKEGMRLRHCCAQWWTCFPSVRSRSLVEQRASWCQHLGERNRSKRVKAQLKYHSN